MLDYFIRLLTLSQGIKECYLLVSVRVIDRQCAVKAGKEFLNLKLIV